MTRGFFFQYRQEVDKKMELRRSKKIENLGLLFSPNSSLSFPISLSLVLTRSSYYFKGTMAQDLSNMYC
jgi:hypothetical protein